jgi:hypothetical protein
VSPSCQTLQFHFNAHRIAAGGIVACIHCGFGAAGVAGFAFDCSAEAVQGGSGPASVGGGGAGGGCGGVVGVGGGGAVGRDTGLRASEGVVVDGGALAVGGGG